ncbi:MAG: DUF305 domain-containing protein [Brevundimonas sp.]|uniref:DUF305 domain-containing protein n=1 Tax=Brevundimonas sp. TaxID=1871086 RepID=UPI002736384A|nr:DUF305 domain-containing protein [Brevundimonas sp.]MDP3656329.1 DUF305 domain-containing protein [Brevundimonas sp.]
MRRALVALGMVMALTGCDGGGDPVQQALRDASAANHAATVREGEVTQRRIPATDQAAMGHGATAGALAFAAAEAKMHARMGAASGGTVDEAYIARMIEHHRGAVAMADVALARSGDPEIRRMARAVKDTQTREIAEMRAWTPSAEPTP